MNKENAKIIERLEKQYAKNPEALEVIERAKKDIKTIERKEETGGYDGQPSNGIALELEAFLHDSTLRYGGILTSICMWSTHASASSISTFFCLHNVRSISPMSFSTVHRFFSCGTSVQIRCDTDNGILNVMCFLSRFFRLSLSA